jgi:hypothetical protein
VIRAPAGEDFMDFFILPVGRWLDPDDELARHHRQFVGPPETWVGNHGPDDEPTDADPERHRDWQVWYRVESVSI